MLLDIDDCQLVLVDYQARLMPALSGGEGALQRALFLGEVARRLGVPVFGTEQNPDKLGPNDAAVRALCQRTYAKMHFNACHSDLISGLRPPAKAGGNARSLPKHLQKPVAPTPSRNTVVLAGCEAHVCLLQTALGLRLAAWDVWVVEDACASRTEANRDAAFRRLASAGAHLVTTEMVLFEWLRRADHARFGEVLRLIK